MHYWINLLRLFLSPLNVFGLLSRIYLGVEEVISSSGSSSLSFQSCLASVRAAGDRTGSGVGVSVRGMLFLISFWCAAGLNSDAEAVLVGQYADGATVHLGVSVDFACWGLPAGSADLVSLSLSVGAILPSVTGDSVGFFPH